jgi:hypothetical protein
MADYISREKINEAFDSIWDCADMVFEPDDHCCAADDCGHCKWLQTKNAIKKKLDHISAADVRPVVRGKWIDRPLDKFRKFESKCSVCGWSGVSNYDSYVDIFDFNFCPNCGADMREQGAEGGA